MMREKENRPLVSVVIPCFNDGHLIDAAVQSCLRQTYSPLEIILVDDGSTDDSLSRIKELAVEHPGVIRWTTQANKGLAGARNTGAKMIRGEYIQWLDADDLLEPDKVRPQVEFLEAHPEVDGVYGDWKDRVYSERFVISYDWRRSYPLDDFALDYLRGLWAPVHSFLIRGPLMQRYQFDETLRAREDGDFWFHHALRGASFAYLFSDDCAIYRRRLAGREHLVETNEFWLQMSLKAYDKARTTLSKAGLLNDTEYRRALASAYLSVTQIGFYRNCPRIADHALARALELADEDELQLMPFPYDLMGLERAMRAWAFRRRVKETVKKKLYGLLSFDVRLPLRVNLKLSLPITCSSGRRWSNAREQ